MGERNEVSETLRQVLEDALGPRISERFGDGIDALVRAKGFEGVPVDPAEALADCIDRVAEELRPLLEAEERLRNLRAVRAMASDSKIEELEPSALNPILSEISSMEATATELRKTHKDALAWLGWLRSLQRRLDTPDTLSY